jgi:YbbR domain-containing protein
MKKIPDFSFLTKHWQLKLLSLIIGASLWYFVVGEDQMDVIVTIPLELHNLPADLVIANQYKKDIEVAIRGPRRLIQEMRQQNISRPVDLSKAEPGTMVIQNDGTSIPFPHGITVQRVQPTNITLLVDRLIKKDFAITPLTKGKPAAGFVLENLVSKPPRITVTGPQNVLDRVASLTTSVVDLEGLDRNTTFQVHLNLDEDLLKLIGETVVETSVILKEIMVKKTVRGIPINIRDGSATVKTVPAVVTVEAEIPDQIVRMTPELSMLFRAAITVDADTKTEEVPVLVNGISLPGHAPIVILNVSPDKVRLLR